MFTMFTIFFMIGIRTPFRVSFAGGSTDIPNFYKKYGGKVVSTSIDKELICIGNGLILLIFTV